MSTKSRFAIVASLLLGSVAFAEPPAGIGEEADRYLPSRNVSIAAGPSCPDPADLYAQCPDFGPNGSESRFLEFSDGAGDISLADNFSLPDGGAIHRVRWWGMYLLMGSKDGCNPAVGDNFSVAIWLNRDGAPDGGQPLPLPSHSVARADTPAGELIVGLGAAPIFEYELTFVSGRFETVPGETYWIEIRNNLGPFCMWVWMTAPSPPGDASCRQRTPSADPSWLTPTSRGFDLGVSFLRDDSIPAVSTYGTILLSMILLAAGAVLIRSRSQGMVGSRQ